LIGTHIIGSVKKELRPVHDNVSCDVCGRTILKGERTEAYQSADGRRFEVCELCFERADGLGWIRAAGADEAFARAPRPEPRRSLLGRLRGRRPEPPARSEAPPVEQEPVFEGGNGSQPPGPEPEPTPPPRSRPKHPRHVRAVPTTAEAKVERSLDVFNESGHQRTVAGLARTLGTPFVAAVPSLDEPSFVDLVVAWELSWYRFRVDLGDAADPVVLVENGEELEQIDQTLRDWNATIDGEGRLLAGNAVTEGGAGET